MNKYFRLDPKISIFKFYIFRKRNITPQLCHVNVSADPRSEQIDLGVRFENKKNYQNSSRETWKPLLLTCLPTRSGFIRSISIRCHRSNTSSSGTNSKQVIFVFKFKLTWAKFKRNTTFRKTFIPPKSCDVCQTPIWMMVIFKIFISRKN